MDTIRMGIYHDKLLRRRRETISSLKRLEEENVGTTNGKQLDWIENSVARAGLPLVNRLNEDYSRELARIQAALGRIRSGTYGECLGCHRAIEKNRLDSFPEANFCSRCQQATEN